MLSFWWIIKGLLVRLNFYASTTLCSNLKHYGLVLFLISYILLHSILHREVKSNLHNTLTFISHIKIILFVFEGSKAHCIVILNENNVRMITFFFLSLYAVGYTLSYSIFLNKNKSHHANFQRWIWKTAGRDCPERKIEYFQEQEAPLYVHNRISQPTTNEKQTYPE